LITCSLYKQEKKNQAEMLFTLWWPTIAHPS